MKPINILILTCIFFINSNYALDKKKDCKCREPATNRIIGGKIARESQFPWQITISYKESFNVPELIRQKLPLSYKIGRHTCGGSIINEKFILTAAHCIPSLNDEMKSLMVIGYGDNDLVRIYNENKYLEVENFFIHPNFNDSEAKSVNNDIALIKLKNEIKFLKNVQPACLPNENVDIYESVLKVIGWGSIKPVFFNPKSKEMGKSEISRFLKEADTYDFSNNLEICKGIKKNFICVSNEEKGDSPCKGDSGGPLIHLKNGKSTVIGVASFVNLKESSSFFKICAGETAYTRLSTYIDWIKKYVNDDYCS